MVVVVVVVVVVVRSDCWESSTDKGGGI